MTADPLPTDALVADLGRMVAELDALRRLEEACRHLRVAQADPWGPDDQQVEWERDRVREALAALDRIREEADR